jgi:lysophospholipase L1-like esterase
MSEHTNQSWPGRRPEARDLPSGAQRSYVRFVALGDSATCGVGDPAHDGTWRGWARILAEAIAEDHDLSFLNLAVPGSTTADVLRAQVPEAIGHHAHLAALIVGLNDTMRASWDPNTIRTNLFACAEALTAEGAVLMTVRFHDHVHVLRLPRPLARTMSLRIEELNEILDAVHDAYGGLHVDLSDLPEVRERAFWSFDRLHPSELGHRALAGRFAALLHEQGLLFTAPSLECTGPEASPRDNLLWVVNEVIPWLGRRAYELAPALALSAVRTLRVRRCAESAA